MPGIVRASRICPLDCNDPEKRPLSLVPTAGRARPEHNLICLQRPHCSFLSCCHLLRSDVTTHLTNRSWVTNSHRYECTKINKYTRRKKKVRDRFSILSNFAKRHKLRSQKMSCTGIKNYSNSRMWLGLHEPRARCLRFVINWLRQKCKNCPRRLLSLLRNPAPFFQDRHLRQPSEQNRCATKMWLINLESPTRENLAPHGQSRFYFGLNQMNFRGPPKQAAFSLFPVGFNHETSLKSLILTRLPSPMSRRLPQRL